MKITYDELGRVSEIKFDDGENQELGFKAFESLIKDQIEANKYAIDKNIEVNKYLIDKNAETNMRVMEFNYAMASIKFNGQLKPCNANDDPNKGIPSTV